MSALFSVICYSSKRLKDGTSPLMMRITKDRERKYSGIGISVDPQFWDFKKNQPKRNCPNRAYIMQIIRNKESEIQKRIFALDIQGDYSIEEILATPSPSVHTARVEDFYRELIEDYQRQGKTGNSLVYTDPLRPLRSYCQGNLNFRFKDITPKWCAYYEKWLRDKGCKETTISVLFRTLRSVFNKAIKANMAEQKDYPFHDFLISKFDTSTKKRALSKTDVMKILEADLTDTREYVRLSRDLFTFSYLCGGINFVDMAYLKPENIENGRLSYIRQKTGKRINVTLCSKAAQIIQNYSRHNGEYLFPILHMNKHVTPIQCHNRIHKMLSKVNSNLQYISHRLGIEAHLTTYVARHSFATVLKKSGVNVALISEVLGHSDISTTQIYLDSFENSEIDEAMKNLL